MNGELLQRGTVGHSRTELRQLWLCQLSKAKGMRREAVTDEDGGCEASLWWKRLPLNFGLWGCQAAGAASFEHVQLRQEQAGREGGSEGARGDFPTPLFSECHTLTHTRLSLDDVRHACHCTLSLAHACRRKEIVTERERERKRTFGYSNEDPSVCNSVYADYS